MIKVCQHKARNLQRAKVPRYPKGKQGRSYVLLFGIIIIGHTRRPLKIGDTNHNY